MSLFLLLLASAFVYAAGTQQWLKHWRLTVIQNKNESATWRKGWNWFSNMIWPAYLMIFATGLWLNNLVIV